MAKDRFGRETVPCGTCGEPTSMLGTKRCDGCWEVEARLAGYLRVGGIVAALTLRRAIEEAGFKCETVDGFR